MIKKNSNVCFQVSIATAELGSSPLSLSHSQWSLSLPPAKGESSDPVCCASHLWISTPKKMLTSRVEPSDVCLPNNRTPASGLKWSQTCSCNNCLFTLVCVKSAFKVSNLLIRFKTPQINLLRDSLQLTWPGMLTNYNLKSGTSFVQLDFGTMTATQPNVPNEAWPTFPVPWWSSSLPRHPPGLTY